MPTPSRTSLDEIVETGRQLIETDGIEGLTMHKVASAVDVRAPSLYKHVQSRGDLIRLIIEAVAADLGKALESAITGADPLNDLEALARTFRDFAINQAESYRLLFAPIPDEWRPDPSALARASEPVLRTTEALVGPDHALDAARFVTAWAHGFMTMELAGAFRLQGDLEGAFSFGITRLAAALSSN